MLRDDEVINFVMKEQKSPDMLWELLLAAGISVVFLIAVAFLLMPKRLNGYYLSADANNGLGTCISADWSWQPDQRVFCSNDPNAAIEQVKKLNEGLK